MTDYIAPALRGLAAYQLPGASGIVRNMRQKKDKVIPPTLRLNRGK